MAWHKDSRYWRFGMWTLILSVVLSIYFDQPGPFMTVAPIFLTGAAGMNVTERLNQRMKEDAP